MDELNEEVLQFVLDSIDTVPHLETLLLLHGNPQTRWSVESIAERIYLSQDSTIGILRDLADQGLVVASETSPVYYAFKPRTQEKERLTQLLAEDYRRHLRPVTRVIHSKAPRSVLEFARAFRIGKEGK